MSDLGGLSSVFEGMFGSVSARGQQHMAESAEILNVPTGGLVFSEGEHADALYVVLAGTIQLRVNQRERDLAAASVGPGELLGWSWLVPPHRWDFDAAAPSGAQLARIPVEVALSVMQDDPADAAALGAAVLTVVSRRLRDTRIQLLDLFARSDPGAGA